MKSTLNQCMGCQSYNPHSNLHCLHCEAPLLKPYKRGSALKKVAATAVITMTMSACYGAPSDLDRTFQDPVEPPTMDSTDSSSMVMVPPVRQSTSGNCSDLSMDLDEDGYCGPQDCDETNPFIQNCVDDPQGGQSMTAGVEISGVEAGGSDIEEVDQAGGDAAGTQAGSDGGRQAGDDQGEQAGHDGGTQAGHDGGTQAGAEDASAGTDGGIDGGTDSITGGGDDPAGNEAGNEAGARQ